MSGNRNFLFGKGGNEEEAVALKPVAGRESAHDRHPEMSLRVIDEAGDQRSYLYGLLGGGPFFDPSRGIRLIFEGWHFTDWDTYAEGKWLVTITGTQLHDLFNHLTSSKLEFIRIGEIVSAVHVRRLDGK